MEKDTAASQATPNQASPEALIQSVAMREPELGEIMERFRSFVRTTFPELGERVRYGGVMFGDELFGVFPYKKHVSVEFSHGVDLNDPHGVLVGAGKFRRHIVLRTPADIETSHLAEYVHRTVRG